MASTTGDDSRTDDKSNPFPHGILIDGDAVIEAYQTSPAARGIGDKFVAIRKDGNTEIVTDVDSKMVNEVARVRVDKFVRDDTDVAALKNSEATIEQAYDAWKLGIDIRDEITLARGLPIETDVQIVTERGEYSRRPASGGRGQEDDRKYDVPADMEGY